MENEKDTYIKINEKGIYDYASYFRRRSLDNPYVTYSIDIETELMRIVSEVGADGVTWSGKIENWSDKIEKSPLDEAISKMKLGMKPYYHEKLKYYIDGSNDGIYLEYDPDTSTIHPSLIEWFAPSLVIELNLCYELKKKLHEEHIEAKKKYKMDISDINTSILNYKTKGHDLNL